MAGKDIEIVDGKVQPMNQNGSHEVALRDQGQIVHAQERTADEIIARLDKIKEVQKKAMVEGVDFGVIPGTERKDAQGKDISKPTLLKAGSEKLCVLFNLDAQFIGDGNSEQIIVETLPDGTVIRHLLVKRYCTIYSQVSGARLGGASAICSTLETKYAYRKAARVCPNCQKENIRRSRPRPGESGEPGWYCWVKTGGCGKEFAANDSKITEQKEGRVPNVDVADQFNTVIRIAEKRALVAAVRLVTGASAIFDEESPDIEGEHIDTGAQTSKETGAKTSEKKTNAKGQTKPENASAGTGTQGNATSNGGGGQTSTANVSSGDGSGVGKGKQANTVSEEQAKELTELCNTAAQLRNEDPATKMVKVMEFIKTKDQDASKMTFADAPADRYNILKQMLNTQIKNAQKAQGAAA